MNILRNLWQKNKFPIRFGISFSVVYVTVGCLWFLAPYDNSSTYPRNFMELVVPILGLANIFLSAPPYVFVPILAIAGWFAGLITEFWLDPKRPITLVGTSILIVLIVINYGIGLVAYTSTMLWWP
jgi:hypothetical protein